MTDRNPILLLLAAGLLALAAPAHAQPAPRGHLVVVGGGGVPDVVLSRAIELAGGPSAPVVIFPQASELADTGDVAAEMWKKAGATNVRWMPLTDAAAARQAAAQQRGEQRHQRTSCGEWHH